MTDEQKYYRECFTSTAGKLVLANMMAETRMFDACHTPEEMAVNNFMKMVLVKLGVIYPDNYDRIANALLELPQE